MWVLCPSPGQTVTPSPTCAPTSCPGSGGCRGGFLVWGPAEAWGLCAVCAHTAAGPSTPLATCHPHYDLLPDRRRQPGCGCDSQGQWCPGPSPPPPQPVRKYDVRGWEAGRVPTLSVNWSSSTRRTPYREVGACGAPETGVPPSAREPGDPEWAVLLGAQGTPAQPRLGKRARDG